MQPDGGTEQFKTSRCRNAAWWIHAAEKGDPTAINTTATAVELSHHVSVIGLMNKQTWLCSLQMTLQSTNNMLV